MLERHSVNLYSHPCLPGGTILLQWRNLISNRLRRVVLPHSFWVRKWQGNLITFERLIHLSLTFHVFLSFRTLAPMALRRNGLNLFLECVVMLAKRCDWRYWGFQGAHPIDSRMVLACQKKDPGVCWFFTDLDIALLVTISCIIFLLPFRTLFSGLEEMVLTALSFGRLYDKNCCQVPSRSTMADTVLFNCPMTTCLDISILVFVQPTTNV